MKKTLQKLLGNNLFKAGGAYTIATFALKGVNFFTIPIFTSVLNVTEYGVVNNFVAWVSIFSIFIGLNLNAAINTAFHEYRADIDRFLSSVIWLSFIIFSSFVIVGATVTLLLGKTEELGFELFVLLQSFVSFVISFQSTYYMIRNEYCANIMLSFLSTFANVGFSLVFMLTIFSSHPDLGRIVGSSVGLFLLAVPLFIRLTVRGKTLYHKIYWGYALKVSVPLIPHAIGNFVISQFDRIMIQHYNGSYSVGLYSFVYNIATIISVLWTASNNAWVPWFFSKFHNEERSEIRKAANVLTSVFMALTAILMPLSVEVAGLLGPETYSKGVVLIMPVTLGYFFQFMYGFPVNLEFALKRTGFIGVSTAIVAFINVMLNMVFLPRFGYIAAGYTTLVTYTVLFIMHFFVAKRLNQFALFDGKWFFLSSFLMTGYMGLQILAINTLLLRYALMVVYLLFLLVVIRKQIFKKEE